LTADALAEQERALSRRLEPVQARSSPQQPEAVLAAWACDPGLQYIHPEIAWVGQLRLPDAELPRPRRLVLTPTEIHALGRDGISVGDVELSDVAGPGWQDRREQGASLRWDAAVAEHLHRRLDLVAVRLSVARMRSRR
jgi:hypothetical protein